jgi:hypothetical protein
VDVCATESVFIQVTVVPTVTFRSSGAKALFPRIDAPLGMVTAATVVDEPSGGTDDGDGDGAGEGDGDGAGVDDE